MNYFKCPMCGARGLERFPEYNHCHECNYFGFGKNRPIPERKIKPRKEEQRLPFPLRTAYVDLQDQFTEEDHQIVRKALLSIPAKERRVVRLHFWKKKRKHEIAGKLGVEIQVVEAILETAFDRLRDLCLRDPRFSRALESMEEVAA